MSKRHIIILCLILGSALVGLIITQARYFQTAFQLREAQFGFAVNRALSTIVSSIEERDKLILAEAERDNKSALDSLISSGVFGHEIDSSEFGRTRITVGGLAITASPHTHTFMLSGRSVSGLRSKFGAAVTSHSSVANLGYELVFADNFVDVPIEERLHRIKLYELITTELLENDIESDFEFAIKSGDKNIYMSENYYNRGVSETYNRKIFLRGMGDDTSLSLVFPTIKHSVWETIKLVIPSLLITVLIVCGCLFCLMEILKEKKLSNIKNDFINNMTHELKTPIATISLASQMLKDGAVSHAPDSINRIAGIVFDESKRLTMLVEKVLQSALFTETRMKLKKKSLHINEFVENFTQKFALRVEGCGGEIYTHLEAEEDEVYVDEMHLTNVISNLLDNAIKYCQRTPEISVYSRNNGNNVIISVVDNGIGIAQRDLKMIFERFYRVSTGNRHDVKGFGLGLSYVKTIVEAHGGRVSVESQEGKGTRFDVVLPLVKVNAEQV